MELIRETLEKHFSRIISAVFSYYFKSLQLVYYLCEKMGYPEEKVSGEWRTRIADDQITGVLNDEWDYFFHGMQCRFDNIKTGQVVDAQLKNYGYLPDMLDPGFFLKYVNTTEKYADVAAFFNDDYENAHMVIHTLLKLSAHILDYKSTYLGVITDVRGTFSNPLTDEEVEKIFVGEPLDDPSMLKPANEVLSTEEIDVLLSSIIEESSEVNDSASVSIEDLEKKINELKKAANVIKDDIIDAGESNVLSQDEIEDLLNQESDDDNNT